MEGKQRRMYDKMKSKEKMSFTKEDRRFQYKLAFFVFILTIIAALISGWGVHYLTKDDNPQIYISSIFDGTHLRFNLKNIKNVAEDVYVSYGLKGYDEKIGWKIYSFIYEGENREESIIPDLEPYCKILTSGMILREFESYLTPINLEINVQCRNCEEKDIIYSGLSYPLTIKCKKDQFDRFKAEIQ